MLVFFRLDLNHVSVRKTTWQAGILKKRTENVRVWCIMEGLESITEPYIALVFTLMYKRVLCIYNTLGDIVTCTPRSGLW